MKTSTPYDSLRTPRWMWWLLAICGAVSCYFALRSGFCADDFVLLWESRQPFGTLVHRYILAPDMFSVAYYRPLQRLVHLVEFKAFGSTAMLYHAVSLLIHLFNAILAHRLFRKLGAPAAVATLAAALFAIHPAQTESVTFISALSGVLAAACLLGALNLLMRFIDTGDMRTGWAVLLLSALALLSKEDAISLPLTLGIVWWFYSQRRNRVWPVVATLPLVASWFIWRLMIGGVIDPAASGFSLNPLTVFRNLAFHLIRFVAPVRSLFRLTDFDRYYQLRDLLQPTPQGILYVSIVVVIVALGGYWFWRRWRSWPAYIRAGLGIAISGLLLYLPLRESATRFLYFPIAGLSVAAVGILLDGESRWRRVVLHAWVAVLALSTVEQTSTWYQAGRRVEVVLAEAVKVTAEHSPEVGTVFVDYPRRHYAAYVFPIGLEYAVRWRTGYDWPHLHTMYDLPLDPNVVPDSLLWYRWDKDRFVPTNPRNQ